MFPSLFIRTPFFRSGTSLLAVLLLALIGFVPAAAEDKSDGPYRLRAGDEINVAVTPQRDYSSGGVILPDGDVYLKNLGKVKAAGLTLEELRTNLLKALEQELNNPKVLVTLVRMAPPPTPPAAKPVKPGKVTLVGAVANPGPLELEPNLRLRKAIDLAGGILKGADLTNIVIIHADLTRSIVDLSVEDRVLDPAHNRLLKDGDSVEIRTLPEIVPTAASVTIRGQVLNPGQYDLKKGMGLEDLIVAAGKLSPMADVEKVQLKREGQPVRTVDLVAQQRLGLDGKILLQAGDEVFIPEADNGVFIVGAIPNPGRRSFTEGQRLREFLLNSGDAGVYNPAVLDLQNAEVVRRGVKAPIKVDLKAVLRKAERPDNLALQNGDILFVPAKRAPKTKPLEALGSALGPVGFLFGLF